MSEDRSVAETREALAEHLLKAPSGMPRHLAGNYEQVRDILYLAAHDTAFGALPLPKLIEMLNTHLRLGQAMVHQAAGWPIFAVLWARMSDDSVRKLMAGGYQALEAADLKSGERVVLVGVCSPWRQEDFEDALGWSALNLVRVAPGGIWYLVLPPEDGMPARLTRYVQLDETNGRFEEARL